MAPFVDLPQEEPSSQPLVWDQELTRRFWNYQSKFKETYFTSQYGKAIVGTIRDWLPEHCRVLDYACGTGALTGHVLKEGMSVAACDLSPDSLAVLNRQYGHLPTFLGTIPLQELGSFSEPFDVVLLVELVEHVDDVTLGNVFDDVKRALAPGGLVIVTTPNDENLNNETVYCPCCSKTFHRWQHVRSWRADSLSALFSRHGLDTVEVFGTDFSNSPSNGWVKYMLRRVVRKIVGRKSPHLVGIARKGA